MNELENTSPNVSRSSINSPPITENSNYRRPGSAADSIGSGSPLKLDDLPRNWLGSIFLFLHILVGTLMLLWSIFDFVCSSISLFESQVRLVFGIHPIVAFLASGFILVSLAGSLIVPYMTLFSKSLKFRTDLYLKISPLMLYSSLGVLIGGILCIFLHIWLAYFKSERLTVYLAASAFLSLHGLLALRFYVELCGGVEGGAMMLPFVVETKENSEFEAEEMSEIYSEEVV